MAATTNKEENTYPIDPENAVEMARLLKQDKLLTKTMGGPLSEQANASLFHNVLDLACGPGGWVLDVAQSLPDTHVTGVDISKLMTDYGNATSQARGLQNAHFITMNIQELFPFEDDTFDLVNARALVAVMTAQTWPKMLRETFRVTRPGGVIRLTEGEQPLTNSPAFEQFTQLLINAFSMTGRTFALTTRNFGTTSMLSRLLRQAGYQNIQLKMHSINSSAGTEGHESFYQDFMAIAHLGKNFFIDLGLINSEKYEELYQQLLLEMSGDDFCAIGYMLTAWGEKPKE